MATTLVLKNRQKNGGARYGLQGMRASAYFPPSMFVGDPPDSLEVNEPTNPAIGPDGQPLKDDAGNPVQKGTIFATEMKARGGAGGGGQKVVNAELQAARQKAKELREESKRVLREARQATKGKTRGGKSSQPSLTEDGATSANV